MGADDYIVKPFSIEEIEKRIEAVLKKNKGNINEFLTLHIDQIKIDFENKIVLKDKLIFQLTEIEVKILRLLTREENKIFSREEIINFVWGFNSFNHSDSRIVDVYISKLRSKIENEPENPVYLQTIRGIGYKFLQKKKNKVNC